MTGDEETKEKVRKWRKKKEPDELRCQRDEGKPRELIVEMGTMLKTFTSNQHHVSS